jgi:hypothetical protein
MPEINLHDDLMNKGSTMIPLSSEAWTAATDISSAAAAAQKLLAHGINPIILHRNSLITLQINIQIYKREAFRYMPKTWVTTNA